MSLVQTYAVNCGLCGKKFEITGPEPGQTVTPICSDCLCGRDAGAENGRMMDTPTIEPVAPKPTARTMAFKVMLATWAGNAVVIYLATRGFFIPDELKTGLAGLIAEGLNVLLPLLTTWIAGRITRVVAQISADKTIEKAKAQTLAAHVEIGRQMEAK